MQNKSFLVLLVLSVVILQACKTDKLNRQNESSDTNNLSAINCKVNYSCEDWHLGYYLDTLSVVSRNYPDVLSAYSIDSLGFARVINNLFPRSCSEFNCFYDSLTKSNGNRKLYFHKIDTLFVRYAAYDSAGCFQLILNMTKFIDPRKIDNDWISELELDIYYCVLEDNLYNFRNFYDTCKRDQYYFLPEWVDVYNSLIRHRP